jgi:hypothetical protein
MRRQSSPGLPPMVKSPPPSAASTNRNSSSSAPPPLPPSPSEHGQYRPGRGYSDDARFGHPSQQSAYAYHAGGAPPGFHVYTPSQSYAHQLPPSTEGGRNGFAGSTASGMVGSENVEITHTDDAATKLSDRVRRRCFNCCTTETSTWRRSSLNPGKVVRAGWQRGERCELIALSQLCNKCGLFERTHSRPRPEQFPHKRGPGSASGKSAKTGSAPPSSAAAPQAPPPPPPPPQVVSARQQVPPTQHFDHPSLAPLRSRAESMGSPRSEALPAIKSLLNSPEEARAPAALPASPPKADGAPVTASRGLSRKGTADMSPPAARAPLKVEAAA